MHCLSKVEVQVVPVFHVSGGVASVASSYVEPCELIRTHVHTDRQRNRDSNPGFTETLTYFSDHRISPLAFGLAHVL